MTGIFPSRSVQGYAKVLGSSEVLADLSQPPSDFRAALLSPLLPNISNTFLPSLGLCTEQEGSDLKHLSFSTLRPGEKEKGDREGQDKLVCV